MPTDILISTANAIELLLTVPNGNSMFVDPLTTHVSLALLGTAILFSFMFRIYSLKQKLMAKNLHSVAFELLGDF